MGSKKQEITQRKSTGYRSIAPYPIDGQEKVSQNNVRESVSCKTRKKLIEVIWNPKACQGKRSEQSLESKNTYQPAYFWQKKQKFFFYLPFECRFFESWSNPFQIRNMLEGGSGTCPERIRSKKFIPSSQMCCHSKPCIYTLWKWIV